MRINVFLILIIFIFAQNVFAKERPCPVIFVHGIGTSSVDWENTGPAVSKYYEKYYKTFSAGSGIGKDRFDKDFSDNIRNSCVYVTFSDHFASPDKLVQELKKVIDDTMAEAKVDKVNLVCHSMGGLAAREYLVQNPKDHHIAKLILIGAPNLGSNGAMFNWVPAALSIAGIGGAIVLGNPIPLGLAVIGVSSDIISYTRGVKLLSPAVEAMKPGSKFLKELNSKPMPENIEYTVIISNTTHFSHVFTNRILGYDGGDGATSIESQRFSEKCVPNFAKLKYSEVYIDAPHFEEPDKAKDPIIKSLGF